MIGSNSIMLDLETLGTGPTSVILSIGAVRFTADEIVDTFEVHIDPQSCIDAGMTIDGDTLLWWLGRSQDVLDTVKRDRVPKCEALWNFATWAGYDVTEVWGNGSDFDNVILLSAYRIMKFKAPWKHTANRCYRTMKNIFPAVELERIGTHHDALDDAKSQALHLMRINEAMRGRD